MNESKEKDAEIGKDFFLQLHRITARLAKRHEISIDRSVDYLLAGSLFTAAHVYGLSIDDTVEVIQEIAESVQQDDFPQETRH
ncbi:hypothetical protein R0137_08100 [Congregibacter brevis]|uniref:Uncharacterized protein n=1 Tax=Congregibacter brevis TaxID=3081201 RepID=A0ABZ0IHN3_9GAMM|nr:hypothetical protein R0137_08100 [Congregibacter sp. IMCC45268]